MAEDNWSFSGNPPPLTVAEELRHLAKAYGCPPNVRPIDWIRTLLEELSDIPNED